MSDILGQYEKDLPIEESPNSDFYIRGLNDSEESVRIPFSLVGASQYCDVDFVCFVENTQYNIPFTILERTTVRFEDRIHTNRAIYTYAWYITDIGTDVTSIYYSRTPSIQFNDAGTFSISLIVKDDEGNTISSISKANHITVSAQPVTLYQVLFTVVDDDSSEPLEGASIMFNNQTQLTGVNGTALFENIPSGSVLSCLVTLTNYNPRISIAQVTQNLSIEVRMELEQDTPVIPEYYPIYLGFIINSTQGTDLTEDIIKGLTYPSQVKELNPELNSELFPEQVNAEWKREFSSMNPFVEHTLFLAIAEGTNDEDLTHYQNMDTPIVQGLLSTQCTIEDIAIDIDGSGSGSGSGSGGYMNYRVYIFEGFGPVNYRLSLTSF